MALKGLMPQRQSMKSAFETGQQVRFVLDEGFLQRRIFRHEFSHGGLVDAFDQRALVVSLGVLCLNRAEESPALLPLQFQSNAFDIAMADFVSLYSQQIEIFEFCADFLISGSKVRVLVRPP